VLANDQANVVNVAEVGDGEVPPAQELVRTRVRGQARLPLTAEGRRHQRAAGPSA
jgi:hypothetical protein